MAAACRSIITPIRSSACPTTSRSAPPIEPAVAYSIARQESHFNQKVVSTAHAMGLDAGDTGCGARHRQAVQGELYDRARLLSDPVYNMQMGAAELANC